MPIDGCSNYRIGSNGDIKRIKYRSTGIKRRVFPMMYVQHQVNRSGVIYVKLINDEGKQKVFSVQKLVMNTFLEKGHTYYKTAPEWEFKKRKQVFNNRVDQFVRSDVYDRMKFKPTIYKTIRL